MEKVFIEPVICGRIMIYQEKRWNTFISTDKM